MAYLALLAAMFALWIACMPGRERTPLSIRGIVPHTRKEAGEFAQALLSGALLLGLFAGLFWLAS